MAGRGPAPGCSSTARQSSQRRRRNAPKLVTIVTADGKVHGPELPDTREWPKATLKWWQTWRTCAQASMFTNTDWSFWSFLLDTAVLHAEFWLGDRSVAAELRLRAAKFGATPEDHARLRIAVSEPDGTSGRSARLRTKGETARRRRLLKAIEDQPG